MLLRLRELRETFFSEKMEAFYKEWLRLNSIENDYVQDEDDDKSSDKNYTTPSDIVFENKDLKLCVEKGFHKRQKTLI
ncbi:MAG: hypothetical protein FJ333_10595 [Sphingomonadales bacterium]|nr:hypothetical protein [Sphingomonadales bacterium]